MNSAPDEVVGILDSAPGRLVPDPVILGVLPDSSGDELTERGLHVTCRRAVRMVGMRGKTLLLDVFSVPIAVTVGLGAHDPELTSEYLMIRQLFDGPGDDAWSSLALVRAAAGPEKVTALA